MIRKENKKRHLPSRSDLKGKQKETPSKKWFERKTKRDTFQVEVIRKENKKRHLPRRSDLKGK